MLLLSGCATVPQEVGLPSDQELLTSMRPREPETWTADPQKTSRLPQEFFTKPVQQAAAELIQLNLRLDLRDHTTLTFPPRRPNSPERLSGIGSVSARLGGEGPHRTPDLMALQFSVDENEGVLLEARSYFIWPDQPHHPVHAQRHYEITTYYVNLKQAKQILRVMDGTTRYQLYEDETEAMLGRTRGNPNFGWSSSIKRTDQTGKTVYRSFGEVEPYRLPRYLAGNDRLSGATSLITYLLFWMREHSEPSTLSEGEQLVQMLRRHLYSSPSLSDEMLHLLAEIAGERSYKQTLPLFLQIRDALPELPEDTAERMNEIESLTDKTYRIQDQHSAIRSSLPSMQPVRKHTGSILSPPEQIRELEKLERHIERLEKRIHEIGLTHQEQELHKTYEVLQRCILKLQHGNDPRELLKLATLETPECSWALRRLRDHFPEEFVSALSKRLYMEMEWKQDILLEELQKTNPVIASQEAKNFLDDEDPPIAAQALQAVLNVEDLPNESHYVKRLLQNEHTFQNIEAVFKVLVPASNPGRFPDPEIEDTLLRIVKRSEPSSYEWEILPAAKALVRRDKKTYLAKLIERYESSSSYQGDPVALGFLIQQSRDDPALRGHIDRLVLEALTYSNRHLEELIHLAWVLDLRDCTSRLEELAALEDKASRTEEHMKALGFDPQQDEPTDAAGHLLSLWEDADPMHDAKELIVFALQNPDIFYEPPASPAWQRFNLEMQKQTTFLFPEELNRLHHFLEWAAAEVPKDDDHEKRIYRYLLLRLKESLSPNLP